MIINHRLKGQQISRLNVGHLRLLLKVGLGLGGLWLLWQFKQPVGDMLAIVSERMAVIAYLEQFGLWGPLLLGLILMLQVIVAAIPGHILMIAGGYLYGAKVGFFVSLVSTVGASQCAFALARWAGRPLIVRLAPASVLDRWNEAAEQKGLIFFLFSFLLPIFPSDVMNFVAGLSSIPARHFLIANFFGRLPGIMLLTAIGAYGFEIPMQIWPIIIGGGGCMFGLWWYCLGRDGNEPMKTGKLFNFQPFKRILKSPPSEEN